MACSEDSAAPKGCFSAILSRLLCSGSLPTHPSEHLPQLTSNESTHQQKPPTTESNPIVVAPISSTPNVVARLMGLDPFPNTTSFPQRTTLDSILNLRSKSVSYVDFYLPKQVQDKAQYKAHDQAHHRRIQSSVSFRDVPTFLDPQNHDLLILCLDQVDEISRKSELSLKEMVRGVKKRENEEKNKKSFKVKEEKPKKVANEPIKPNVGNVLGQRRDVHVKTSAILKPKSPVRPTVSRKEESVELKSRKKKESENRQRNLNMKSSRVAHHDFSKRVEAQMPDNSRTISSKTAPTSPPRFDKYDHPCPNITSKVKEEDRELRAIMSKTNDPLMKITEDNNYLVGMLYEVCRLTEEETKRGSSSIWMTGKDLKLEKIEEICFEFEQEALEMLLSQLVHELCDSSLDMGSNML